MSVRLSYSRRGGLGPESRTHTSCPIRRSLNELDALLSLEEESRSVSTTNTDQLKSSHSRQSACSSDRDNRKDQLPRKCSSYPEHLQEKFDSSFRSLPSSPIRRIEVDDSKSPGSYTIMSRDKPICSADLISNMDQVHLITQDDKPSTPLRSKSSRKKHSNRSPGLRTRSSSSRSKRGSSLERDISRLILQQTSDQSYFAITKSEEEGTSEGKSVDEILNDLMYSTRPFLQQSEAMEKVVDLSMVDANDDLSTSTPRTPTSPPTPVRIHKNPGSGRPVLGAPNSAFSSGFTTPTRRKNVNHGFNGDEDVFCGVESTNAKVSSMTETVDVVQAPTIFEKSESDGWAVNVYVESTSAIANPSNEDLHQVDSDEVDYEEEDSDGEDYYVEDSQVEEYGEDEEEEEYGEDEEEEEYGEDEEEEEYGEEEEEEEYGEEEYGEEEEEEFDEDNQQRWIEEDISEDVFVDGEFCHESFNDDFSHHSDLFDHVAPSDSEDTSLMDKYGMQIVETIPEESESDIGDSNNSVELPDVTPILALCDSESPSEQDGFKDNVAKESTGLDSNSSDSVFENMEVHNLVADFNAENWTAFDNSVFCDSPFGNDNIIPFESSQKHEDDASEDEPYSPVSVVNRVDDLHLKNSSLPSILQTCTSTDSGVEWEEFNRRFVI